MENKEEYMQEYHLMVNNHRRMPLEAYRNHHRSNIDATYAGIYVNV